MDFKKDKSLGYMIGYSPGHPMANKSGKIYEHRYVMANHLGRMLLTDEHVHHVDGNKTNNSLDNLVLMTNSEHMRMHTTERYRLIGKSERCDIVNECRQCKKEISTKHYINQIYCSPECCSLSRRKFEVSKEELEELVWNMPTTQIAEMYQVSDKAIEKRCKKLGIEKPPRGYWAKQQAAKKK
jgi:hypothetical protein